MAKKDFSYRGKALEQLLTLDLAGFAKLLDSRGRRSVLRGFDKKVLKKMEMARVQMQKGGRVKPIKTHRRDLIVIPQMIGLQFAVHKGNEFQILDVKENMIGHYLGEFALTRKRLTHGKAGIGATKSSTAITARG
ncbi:MAG: 30S ribosomal protein S19 [Candidatus Diapherotrites archaeon]